MAEDLMSFAGQDEVTWNDSKILELLPHCSQGVILSFISSVPILHKYVHKYLSSAMVQFHILFSKATDFWIILFRDNEELQVDIEGICQYLRHLHRLFQNDINSQTSVARQFMRSLNAKRSDKIANELLMDEIKMFNRMLTSGNLAVAQYDFKCIKILFKFSLLNISISNSKLESSFSTVRDILGVRLNRLSKGNMTSHLRIKSFLTSTDGDNILALKKKGSQRFIQATIEPSVNDSSQSETQCNNEGLRDEEDHYGDISLATEIGMCEKSNGNDICPEAVLYSSNNNYSADYDGLDEVESLLFMR
ncbi:hypothetical protein DASC09_019170 [Saccharomycopsis crataegensis]|uniref:Uncharacterized protein n=1 Tax=Saccharomycopsis crataegensis TaxID=43959 RepID=A0AAV5QIZ6_9ASCO|nr:hypothetical protein DASC09_019170 [Saccharomycopsis crataegensis]